LERGGAESLIWLRGPYLWCGAQLKVSFNGNLSDYKKLFGSARFLTQKVFPFFGAPARFWAAA
jgi:hypothetical protein